MHHQPTWNFSKLIEGRKSLSVSSHSWCLGSGQLPILNHSSPMSLVPFPQFSFLISITLYQLTLHLHQAKSNVPFPDSHVPFLITNVKDSWWNNSPSTQSLLELVSKVLPLVSLFIFRQYYDYAALINGFSDDLGLLGLGRGPLGLARLTKNKMLDIDEDQEDTEKFSDEKDDTITILERLY